MNKRFHTFECKGHEATSPSESLLHVYEAQVVFLAPGGRGTQEPADSTRDYLSFVRWERIAGRPASVAETDARQPVGMDPGTDRCLPEGSLTVTYAELPLERPASLSACPFSPPSLGHPRIAAHHGAQWWATLSRGRFRMWDSVKGPSRTPPPSTAGG